MRVVMYTDGSAQGNPGPGGYAALLLYKDQRRTLSEGYRLSTNNRMELMAVIKGLEALEALKEDVQEVHVYSDSRYFVDAVKQGWLGKWIRKGFRKVKNPDLWKRYLVVASKYHVHLHWIKGHAGNREHDHCDEAARQASLGPLQKDEAYEARARGAQDDQYDLRM